MADDGMSLTGDWKGALARMRFFPDDLKRRLQLATRQNAVGFEGEVKKGMVSQAPGGVPYQPLHPWTIALRLMGMSAKYRAKVEKRAAVIAAGGGIAHKALINHGDLLGSITHDMYGDDMSAVVGVNRHAKAKNGQPMVNIARIVFYGAIIPVSPAVRKALHGMGLHLRDSTTHVVIPPRPTFEPVYEKYKPTIIERYRKAVVGAATRR
jgi:hypothetical protein